MWSISVHLATYTRNNGKPDQLSSCAIQLNGACPEGTATRTISQFLGNKNQSQSEIYCALAAITAIIPIKTKIELYSNSAPLIRLLTKKDGLWGTTNKNLAMVTKLREAIDKRAQIIVSHDSASDSIKTVIDLAKSTLHTKVGTDTGTNLNNAKTQ